MLKIEAEGLAGAEEMLQKLQELGSVVGGIEMIGEKRNRTNNAQIIQYHADGIESRRGTIVRDITANEEDAQKAADAFAKTADTWLDKKSDVMAAGTKEEIARAARAVATKALIAAMEVIRKIMLDRVKSQTGNNGAALEPVTPEYADYRASKYGVPASDVFKASGSLLSNLAERRYKINVKK